MIKQQTLAAQQSLEKFLASHFSLIFCILVLSIAAACTFVMQNRIVGFEPGYDELAPKHHGSVSSRGLAIIAHATPENGFVGYAFQSIDDQGQVQYDYFDRYPVFFSALFNRVLALRPKLSSKIYVAKQVMNIIFVATLAVAFLLCSKLLGSKLLGLAAALFAFSNPYLLFYKDMVHYDQPALLGFLLLTYTIALYKMDGRRLPVILASFAAIAMGRGYASYAVLGVWLAIEAGLIVKTRGPGFWQKIKQIVKHLSFLLFVLAVVWGAGLLSYNIAVEARTRGIPIEQTSIVDSAVRRLSLSPEFNEQYEETLDWGEYATTEVSRIIQWAFPVKVRFLGTAGSLLVLVFLLAVTAAAARGQSPEKQMIFLILVLSGFAWLIPLRNLAAFHDYTTMYFIGIPLAFFVSVLLLLKPSRDARYYIALLGLVVYLSALIQLAYLHERISGSTSEFTYDFMEIEKAIGEPGSSVYMDAEIPYGTSGLGFYLPGEYLAPLALADYVITANQDYPAQSLTPGNTYLFLFKKEK